MQIASLLLWTIEDYATAENEQPQDDVLVELPIEELATLPAVSPPILEAFEKAADGKATKIIIPSDIQGIAGLAKSVVEVAKGE